MSTSWIELNLPTPTDIGKFVLWVGGRAFLTTTLLGIQAWKVSSKVSFSLAEMSERSVCRLLKVYDCMPLKGMAYTHTLEAEIRPIVDIQPITDIIPATTGKQLMLIGEMGTGKSTLAQYFAYSVGGRVTVYECEGTPEDWQGLEVVGKGEDWDAINKGMLADLADLSNQMQLRNEKGDSALAGSERCIIVEEFPELVSKVEASGEWLDRHARRGRKARRFTILLSQYDRVAAWGLEGKSDLADAFHRIRLGKKAVSHAKSLRNDQLVEWLRSDRSHCLLDDEPCKLPSYQEMRAVIPRIQIQPVLQPEKTPEPPSQSGFQDFSEPLEPVSEVADLALWRSISALLDDGKSQSWIIKKILGYEGGRYQQGVQKFNQLKEEFSAENIA